jgi:hypothetical protein
MRNSLKNLRPKANSLANLPAFLEYPDTVKNQMLGEALSNLMETESFPPPVQKFLEIPKFKELVERLKEGTLDGSALLSGEIHALQLLLESFHNLVHLDYEFEEIEHPVVQAKVLEQNIKDYLTCISLFIPYEGRLINEIVSDLFGSVHFFSSTLKSTILENSSFFNKKLVSFMDSPIISLLLHLDRSNYQDFLMSDWYPVAIELNVDAKLETKKQELAALAKGNAHKILNQLQTVLADISQIYLRTPPAEIASSIKQVILQEFTGIEGMSGQKVNEIFYLEFWKEFYAIQLIREKGFIGKLEALMNHLVPLKMSLSSLIHAYELVLPDAFIKHLKELSTPLEFILSPLGKPNLIGAELSIGFYNTQIEYLNEMLSSPDHKKIPITSYERLTSITPSLISFLETYHQASPLTSFHTLKETFENLFSGPDAFIEYSTEEIRSRIGEKFTQFIPLDPSPLSLLEASLNKITSELHLILKELDPITIEHRVLEEKLFSLERIDLPSYSQTWQSLGEILGVLVIFTSQHNPNFLKNFEAELKKLFSSIFLSNF